MRPSAPAKVRRQYRRLARGFAREWLFLPRDGKTPTELRDPDLRYCTRCMLSTLLPEGTPHAQCWAGVAGPSKREKGYAPLRGPFIFRDSTYTLFGFLQAVKSLPQPYR